MFLSQHRGSLLRLWWHGSWLLSLPGKIAPEPPVSSSNLTLKTSPQIWTWICTLREHGFNLMLTNAYTATLLLWPKAPQLYPPLFWFNQLSVSLWKIFHIWKPPLKMCAVYVFRYDFPLLLLKEIQFESLLQFTLYLGGQGRVAWEVQISVFLGCLEKKTAWRLKILNDSTFNSSECKTKRAWRHFLQWCAMAY